MTTQTAIRFNTEDRCLNLRSFIERRREWRDGDAVKQVAAWHERHIG